MFKTKAKAKKIRMANQNYSMPSLTADGSAPSAKITISVDDCPYIPSYSDQSVYGNSYTRAGNNGMIKKPYFVPFEETVSMVHEGITFEMAKTSIEDRAKVAGPEEQFIFKLARAGIDGLARKYKVGIAHSVTGGPILPGYWGQVHLVDHL